MNSRRIPEGIRKLKKEKNIVLYGASDCASASLAEMLEYGIKPEAVLVSKNHNNSSYFNNFPVYISDDYFANHSNLTVVAGFNITAHSSLISALEANENIKIIYVFDGVNVLIRNNYVFPSALSKIHLIDSYYHMIIPRELDYDYFNKNRSLFDETMGWLEDEKSRKTMDCYLRGHLELAEYPVLPVWKHADVEAQYFPEDVISLSENETFVDCGAYDGDTLQSFLKRTNSFKAYYALEPDPRLDKDWKNLNDPRIKYYPVGAWNSVGSISFTQHNGCGQIMLDDDCETVIHTDRIDNIVQNEVTFIKMDIEGSELNALHGAEQSIKRYKPKLAICVYHKREDLITIPQYIRSLNPTYRFYLRVHNPFDSELVLYCV